MKFLNFICKKKKLPELEVTKCYIRVQDWNNVKVTKRLFRNKKNPRELLLKRVVKSSFVMTFSLLCPSIRKTCIFIRSDEHNRFESNWTNRNAKVLLSFLNKLFGKWTLKQFNIAVICTKTCVILIRWDRFTLKKKEKEKLYIGVKIERREFK